jgi:hypothetical protein
MSSGAPVENGTPIRYPSAALLCVNSADAEVFEKDTGFRIDNNFPNRVYINNGRPLMFGYMTRVALTEVNLQWDTPNVNPNNNTITMSVRNIENEETATIRSVIPEGWYKPVELAAALQSTLNTDWATFLNASPGSEPWLVSVNPITLAISITSSDEGGFDSFLFKIVPCTQRDNGLPPIPLDLTDMLGLTPSPTSGVLFYNIISGSYATYQYTPYVDIISNVLTKNQNVTDNDTTKQPITSRLARLYLSNEEIVERTGDNIIGVRPFVFRREFKFPKQIQWNTTENIDVIDISVLDYKGNPIYIKPIYTVNVEDGSVVVGNTADFMFTVQVTEV